MPIVTLRHYVGSGQQLEELKEITDRIVSAVDTAPDMKFRLKLGNPPYERLTPEIKDGIDKQFRRLREKDVSVECLQGAGISHAFLKCLESSAERAESFPDLTTMLTIDANQYSICDERVLTAIRNMDRCLKEEGYPLALSLRDFVRLAEDDDEDEMRRVNELLYLHALYLQTPSPIKGVGEELSNPQGIETRDIHPAYRRWGETMPGFYFLNPNTAQFSMTMSTISEDLRKADLKAYNTLDAYIMMLLGSITGGKHRIYSEVVPTTRQTRGSRFRPETITQRARVLKDTFFVGPHYRHSVQDEGFERELGEYFKAKNIREVKELILAGFEN